MRVGSWLLLVGMLVVLAGCARAATVAVEPEPSRSASTAAATDWILSDKERAVYALFQKDRKEARLKELEPVSIAKLYVQARLDQDYATVYALYTDRKDYVAWTQAQDEQIPNEDRGTREHILQTFQGLDKGTFRQTSDFTGYVDYRRREDAAQTYGFQMIKDEDGIWNVAFMPIQ